MLSFNDVRQKTNELFTNALLFDIESFDYKFPAVLETNLMIEQNTTFIVMTENCKDCGFLPQKNKKTMISALFQGLNGQIRY